MEDKVQKDTLEFIKNFKRDQGFVPTLREVAVFFNISLGGAQYRMSRLQQSGKIKREKFRSRYIVVQEATKNKNSAANYSQHR
jgi:SOS-response transcriptional repressor LexA